MLSPIMDKIAYEIGSNEQHAGPRKQNRSLRHLHIDFGPVLIGWGFWLWMDSVVMTSLLFKGSACTSHRTENLLIEIEGYNK